MSVPIIPVRVGFYLFSVVILLPLRCILCYSPCVGPDLCYTFMCPHNTYCVCFLCHTVAILPNSASLV